MSEKETKSKEILLKLTELENKKPTLIQYITGLIDGIILSDSSETNN